jgi:cytochrome P450
VFLLVMAGLDTVAASLSCMLEWLARHPLERRQLIDDPSGWPAAIEGSFGFRHQ